MPQYMLLIYVDPAEGPQSPEDRAAMMPRWNAYTQSLKDAGAYQGGDALVGAEAATTVRVRGGETQITDGPYAETKEYLGGYYLIEAPDLDTAINHAAKVPNVEWASIEVRPVMAM
jgi:hypothetical protein